MKNIWYAGRHFIICRYTKDGISDLGPLTHLIKDQKRVPYCNVRALPKGSSTLLRRFKCCWMEFDFFINTLWIHFVRWIYNFDMATFSQQILIFMFCFQSDYEHLDLPRTIQNCEKPNGEKSCAEWNRDLVRI